MNTSIKIENLLTIPKPRLGQLQRLARKAPKCREDALALCSVLQALSPDERAQVHALVGLGRRKGYRTFKAALEAAKRYDLNLIPGMYCEDPTFRDCLKSGLMRYQSSVFPPANMSLTHFHQSRRCAGQGEAGTENRL